MRLFFYVFTVFLCFGLSAPTVSASGDYNTWLSAVKQEARAKGISDATINAAFAGAKPIPRIIELDRKQPEGRLTFAQYKDRVINQNRINKGRRLLKEHRAALDKASQKYGVPPQYIVALWGIESSYGENTGGFKVVHALATLAHDGRRSKFFRTELMNALKIIDAGHIKAVNMKGSWAGAMGQNQFMPSSFHAYAVDGNADGRRDIWTSLPDVFASTANYLGKSGWKEDEKWGRRVKLPAGFAKSLTGTDTKKSVQEWNNLGVRLPNGGALPNGGNIRASVVIPDGLGGPAYLAYNNYRVVLKWNRSTYFATSVGLLADAIAQ